MPNKEVIPAYPKTIADAVELPTGDVLAEKKAVLELTDEMVENIAYAAGRFDDDGNASSAINDSNGENIANNIASIKTNITELDTKKANSTDVYNKTETDSVIDSKVTDKVAEIVAGAPEDFDTLKEMSDWLTEHEDSAAAMNSAIIDNTNNITQLKNDNAINKITLGGVNKNILYNNMLPSSVIKGITVTHNADGSLTFSGICSETSTQVLVWNVQAGINNVAGTNYDTVTYDYTKHIPTGEYIMSTGVDVTDKLSLQLCTCKVVDITASDIKIQGTVNSDIVTVEEDDLYSFCRILVYPEADFTEPVTIYPMIRLSSITDGTYEPYDSTLSEKLSYVKSTLGTHNKNLLPGVDELDTRVTKTIYGIKCNKQENNAVKLNGTATGQVFLYCIQRSKYDTSELDGRELTLTGCPKGGAENTYLIAARYTNANGDERYAYDLGNGVTFRPAKLVQIMIVVRKGVTINNLTFYPMLRYAEITDSTYESYEPSIYNQVQTAKENVAKIHATLGRPFGKNLIIPKPLVDTSAKGFTIARNDDGSITLSGSYTGSSTGYYTVTIGTIPVATFGLAGKTVRFSGIRNDDMTYNYQFDFRNSKNKQVQVFNFTTTLQGKFTIPEDKDIELINIHLLIQSTHVIEGTIYPMVTLDDVIDDSYEPYKLTTTDVNNVIETTIGKPRKNLVKPIFRAPLSYLGISYRHTENGLFYYSGTATGDFSIVIGTAELKAGHAYIMSGEGLAITGLNGDTTGAAWDLSKNGTIITASTDCTVNVTKWFGSGKTYASTIAYPMIREVAIEDNTYEPYEPSITERISQYKNEIAELNNKIYGIRRSTLHKNLFRVTIGTITTNGVTCTNNGDGTVTLSGKSTHTGNIYFRLNTGYDINIPYNKEYILSGTPVDNNTLDSGGTKAYLRIERTGVLIASDIGTNGNGVRFTTQSTNTTPTFMQICVNVGADFTDNPITFKPMLRFADVDDDTFTVYQPPIANSVAIHDGTIGTQCRNLLPYSFVGGTINGCTLTVAGDKTVTVSGTTTASTTFKMDITPDLVFDRDVVISGASTLTNISYMCRLYKSGKHTYHNIGTSDFLVPAGTSISQLYIQQQETGITVSGTIKPMITYADVIDRSYEVYKPSLAESVAINDTTLGTSCKNLLNMTSWLNSIVKAINGTISKTSTSITITATAVDAYTDQFGGSGAYKIPVNPNTKYTLSWAGNNNNDGNVYIFMNGDGSTTSRRYISNKVSKSLTFTTNSDTTFITVRVGVTNIGDSITYSKLMLTHADITDRTYEAYKPSIDTRLSTLEDGTGWVSIPNPDTATFGTWKCLYKKCGSFVNLHINIKFAKDVTFDSNGLYKITTSLPSAILPISRPDDNSTYLTGYLYVSNTARYTLPFIIASNDKSLSLRSISSLTTIKSTNTLYADLTYLL